LPGFGEGLAPLQVFHAVPSLPFSAPAKPGFLEGQIGKAKLSRVATAIPEAFQIGTYTGLKEPCEKVDFAGIFFYKWFYLLQTMAEIYFLGTGGSVATPARDNTSFLLRHGEDLILVDCPGSVIPKIKKLKFDPRRVRIILLTHTHPDHIYGLPSFVHSLMLEEGEIILCASEETVSFSRLLLDIFHLRESKIKTRIRFRPLAPGQTTKLGPGLTARAIQVPHHPSSLAYHFHWEEKNRGLIFSGDTPPSAPVFEAAQEIDFLIHDSSAPGRVFRQFPELHKMHTSALELGKWSQEAGVKCLIPCHFLGEIDFSPTEIRTEIRRSYKGRLIIPRDFEKIKLS